jgi:hypothetical protein
MDSMDNVRERLAALEQRTEHLQQHTRTVERRLRWWRGLACGALVLGLLNGALPSGTPVEAQQGGLPARVAALEARVAALETQPGGLPARVAALEDKLQFVTVSEDEMVITGANLRIVNGLGDTSTTNGLGNVIVGYNEPRNNSASPDVRTGSHNVIVGTMHNFSRFGGIVVGLFNEISGDYASVSGGISNTASAYVSSVSGGVGNTASGPYASVSGGGDNTASGDSASVSGGAGNIARGETSWVTGGTANTASGTRSSVVGGQQNIATHQDAVVSGGIFNTASALWATVSGGALNTASGESAAVSGGNSITQASNSGWSAGSFGDTVEGSFRSPN